MTKRVIPYVLAMGILSLLGVGTGALCQGVPRSAHDAWEKVRATEGLGENDLKTVTNDHAGGRTYYHFDLRSGDEYRVDSQTGEVSAVYGSRIRTMIAGTYTLTDCH